MKAIWCHSTLSCTITPLCLLPSIWISDAQNLLTHSWIVDQWWISELWLRSDGNSLFEWKKSEILFQNAPRVWFTPRTGSILTFNHAATSSLSSSSLKFFYLSSGLASCCQYCPHRVLAALQGASRSERHNIVLLSFIHQVCVIPISFHS